MNTILSFKKGSLDDLKQLKNLGLAAYREYSSILSEDNWSKFEANLNNEIELEGLISKSVVFICQTSENEIVGTAFFIPSGNPTDLFLKDWCCIRRLSVHPDYRGRGIAKKLTELCISQARLNNEKTLALHTSEFMDAARHIYEGMGFIKIKQVDGLYGKRYWIFGFNL